MEISFIEARDLSEAWFLCLRDTLTKGYQYTIDHGSFAGHQRKELDFAVVQVKHPGTRPLVPQVPPGVPPPSSMEYVENYMQYLLTSLKADNEQYTYGQDIEKQIFHVIDNYKRYGFNSNQGFIAVGDSNSILLPDPPCLRGIDTRIRYGQLHFTVYFRSWDLWAGFPSNLAGLQLTKEFMASELNVGDGELIALSKGMHLYDYSWSLAETVCGFTDKCQEKTEKTP